MLVQSARFCGKMALAQLRNSSEYAPTNKVILTLRARHLISPEMDEKDLSLSLSLPSSSL